MGKAVIPKNETETCMRQILLATLPILTKSKPRRLAAALFFAGAAITCSLTVAATPPGQGTAPGQNTSNCGGTFFSQVPFPFADYYSCVDLGSAPGVITPYGGLTFKYDDPNTVLIGGAANDATGRIYQIRVARSANK